MTPPHGSRFGYPGTFTTLFKSVDETVPSNAESDASHAAFGHRPSAYKERAEDSNAVAPSSQLWWFPRPKDVSTQNTAEDDVEKLDDKQQKTCGKRLSRDQRRDILLMRRLGHKYEDIAKFLGVTQAAVQYTVNRGRASPEHRKAGRKKRDHPGVPRHAIQQKVSSEGRMSKDDPRTLIS